MSNRVTQQDIQVVANRAGEGRVTQQSVEALAKLVGEGHVTQQSIEALTKTQGFPRVSQQAIMALAKNTPARSGGQKAQTVTTAKTSPVPVPGDDYYEKVQLLLRSDVGLVDASRFHRTLYGERRSGPFVQSTNTKFGSTVFRQTDASNVSFQKGCSLAPSRSWNLSTKKFTIELWYRPDLGGGADKGILGTWDHANEPGRGWSLVDGGLRALNFRFYDEAGNVHNVSDGASYRLSSVQWHHICVDRDDDGVIRLYDDGVMIASYTFPGKIRDSVEPLYVMGWGNNASTRCRASFDDVRITKGVARYASNAGYTPPTEHFPYRGFESPVWEDDPFWNLCSLYLDAEGSDWRGDESPRAAPITISGGNTLPTWLNGFTWYGETGRFFNLADRSFEVADVDGQHNLGDGSPWTIQYIYQTNFSQGIVTFTPFRWEEIMSNLVSSGSHTWRRWNGSDYTTSIGLVSSQHDYNQSNWVVITYDEHKTVRLYCNGYLVSKAYNIVFPSNTDAKLFLGPSGSIRADDIVIHKGIAMFTDDYGIPAWYAARKPPKTGGVYVPPVPPGLTLPYTFRPAQTAQSAVPSVLEWVQISGNVPARTTKYEQNAGLVGAPENLLLFNLNTTTRLFTAQTHTIPGFFDEIDAGGLQVRLKMKYGMKAGTLSGSCYGVRFEDEEGNVTGYAFGPPQLAYPWADVDFMVKVPAGTRAVAVVFMSYNPETVPATYFDEYQLVLEEATEVSEYLWRQTFPVATGDWSSAFGQPAASYAIDYGLTAIAAANTNGRNDLYHEETIPSGWEADIDAGLASLRARWWASLHSGDTNDGGNVYVEFRDGSDVLLGYRVEDRRSHYIHQLGGGGYEIHTPIPVGARKARVGYVGSISVNEGAGVTSFYPMFFTMELVKPEDMPLDYDPNEFDPSAGDELWKHVAMLLTSRAGSVQNLAEVPNQTVTLVGTFARTGSDPKFGTDALVNNTGAAANVSHYASLNPRPNAMATELTIEGWIRPEAWPRANVGLVGTAFQVAAAGGQLDISGSGVRSDAAPPLNEWTYFAFCRYRDATTACWINGEPQSAAVVAEYNAQWAATFDVGRHASSGSSNNSWTGKLDEIRLTDGVARYVRGSKIPIPTERWPATDGYTYDIDRLTAMFLGGAGSGTNTGSYNFTSFPFGPASATRRIVVAAIRPCAWNVNGDPTSVTIGGVSATKLNSRVIDDGVYGYNISFWSANVPTGTSGTVAVVWSTSGYRAGIMAWSVNDDFDVHAFAYGPLVDGNTASELTIACREKGLILAANISNGGGVAGTNMNAAWRHVRTNQPARQISARRDRWQGIAGTGYWYVENDGTLSANLTVAISLKTKADTSIPPPEVFRRSRSDKASINGTAISVTPSPNVEEDDLMLAYIAARGDVTPPPGWTLVDEVEFAHGSTDRRLQVYSKYASSDESAPYVWTQSISDRSMGAIVSYYDMSGDPVVVLDTATADYTDGSGPLTLPVLTGNADGQMAVYGASVSNTTSSARNYVWDEPTGVGLPAANYNRLDVAQKKLEDTEAVGGDVEHSYSTGSQGFGVVGVLLGIAP